MLKIFRNLFVLLLLIFPISLSSAFEEKTSKTVLDNGLTVLIQEMPTNPMVSIYALVKAGSTTEGKYLGTGISHFLEHMIFKGTEQRQVGEIASQIQALGGSINASTTFDYTIYTVTVPADVFSTALEIMADALMNSKLDPVELEKERQVILGEMRLHHDDPDERLSDLVFQNIYLRHPYRYPIIGFEPLFKQISREDISDYYHTFYVPNNMILSVAGGVQADTILPQIKNALEHFPRQREVLRTLPKEPPQVSPRFFEEEYPTELTRLSLGFRTVSTLDPDLFALDVLANILGQGESSRLYVQLYKNKNLVHGISAYNYTPMDPGLFEIQCLLEEGHVDDARKNIFQEIQEIKKNGITKKELGKSKRQVLSDYVFAHETTSSLAYSQAVDEAFTGDCHFSKVYVESISQVTNEDIKKVAKKYLKPEALTTVILKPQKVEQQSQNHEQTASSAGSIQKYFLENGLTVLLREDHGLPLISVRLNLRGGIHEETSDLNGLFKMLSALWIKGTRSHSDQEIAEMTESQGIRLGSQSGKNSFGLSMSFLSQDLNQAMGLFFDFVKFPTFPQKELDQVKEDMTTALRERDDNIWQSTFYQLRQLLFVSHPYRMDEVGTKESIANIRREDIVKIYNQYRVPGNMVLSIFGDINSSAILDQVKKELGSLKSQHIDLKTYEETSPQEPRQKEFFMDKEQAMVTFGFQGTSLQDHDRYGLEVLMAILGSSFNGRLFVKIRDESADAYNLGGDFVAGIDTGILYLYVLTKQNSVAQVKQLLQEEIQKIQQQPVSDTELNEMKRYLKGNFKNEQQTNSSLSFISGLDELYGLGYDHYQQYESNIDKITSHDIQRLAQKYLDLQKSAVVVTTQKSSKKEIK